MSFAGVRDGLISTIVAGGKFSSSQVSSCDFGIIELCASAVLIAPGPGTSIRPLTFQGTGSARIKEITWDFSGFVFVKDPGDPTAWLSSLWTAADDIFNSVNRDDSLNGTAESAYISDISRPDVDTYYKLRGVDYAVLRFRVKATAWSA